ncbi:Kinesin-like protein [Phytophthora fragariae]|uniref:Kinesin-like protein n=1 Tax=Phytophthora fragariae TaxID=53985 RepID=A0A6A3XAK4_9STRA|nr:Kinesin-like protein [Phytophthora fragariae]KAE8933166.1 Kinesin-like protein [Phytophthora fragariae]KAE8999106.1 Kinesin-like protein [Phytophthora fragariae]KAE9099567.1 Kinesin-like protein [Phytophthora fragariae]KAE9114345.1 Kinesin-like protein [Phytophthora fragariae]
MGRNGVKVIIRTRPTATFATHQLQIDPDDSTITVYSGAAAMAAASGGASPPKTDGGPSNRKDCWQFKFHQVLHNAGQDRVYEAIARDIVHGAVVDGVNGTVLAYGQTGAGKSFTMIGDTRNYQHRGIAPRAIAQLYEEVESRIELQYTIRVSYMEIYNDRIYDLLEGQQGGDRTGNGELVVVEDARGTYVRGLTQVEVRSEQEALDQLFNGELQRTVAEHQLNKRSNRSHCVLTFHIAQKSRAGGTERVTLSKLHLVDLAGSERLKKTLDGDQTGRSPTKTSSSSSKAGSALSTIKKESMYINQSLSFLEQCIVALGSKEQRHIPYRQTKLTNVLKDSLGGNSNTLMFACIWGEGRHLEETISTLKLAQRMMRVQNEVATIVETDPALLLRKYERQIRELKHELVMHDALVERPAVVYDEHTPEQKHELLQMVRRYIDAPTQEMEDEALRLTSVNEIRELFRQFKLLFKSSGLDSMGGAASGMNGSGSHGGAGNANASTRSGSAGSSASRTQTSAGSRDDLRMHATHGPNGEELVGEEVPGALGFPLGLVPGAARPSTMDTSKSKNYRGAGGAADGPGGASPTGNGQRSPAASRSPSGTELPGVPDNNEDDRGDDEGGLYSTNKGGGRNGDGATLSQDAETRAKNDAFQFYRSAGPGRKLHQSLQDEKDKLFDAKQRVKQVTRCVNAAKAQIDAVRAQLEDKRNQRGTHEGGAGNRKTGAKQVPQERDEVVDEEEFILMTAEREAKRDYRSLFGDLKDAKSELEFSLRSVELLRRRLVREFEDWYDEEGHARALSKSSGAAGFDAFARPAFSKDDKLDDGEKFDQMEVDRVRAQDPDSLAFFQAQKKMRQQQAGAIVPASQRKAKR